MGSRKSAPAPIIVEKVGPRNTRFPPPHQADPPLFLQTSHSSQRSARSLDSIDSSSTLSPGGIPRRNMNVYTHCGRHTNQFLFGGRSLTDMARAVFRRD